MIRREALTALAVAPLAILSSSAIASASEKNAKGIKKKTNLEAHGNQAQEAEAEGEEMVCYRSVNDVILDVQKVTMGMMSFYTATIRAKVDTSDPNWSLQRVTGKVYKGYVEISSPVDLIWDTGIQLHKSPSFFLTGAVANDVVYAVVVAEYRVTVRGQSSDVTIPA